jgi:hypothetical protein
MLSSWSGGRRFRARCGRCRIVRDILIQDRPQVPRPGDQHPVSDYSPRCPHPAFGISVSCLLSHHDGVRGGRRGPQPARADRVAPVGGDRRGGRGQPHDHCAGPPSSSVDSSPVTSRASCPRGSDRASAMIRDRSASVIRCLRPHPGRLPSPSMPMALNWCSQRRVTLNTSDGLEHLPNSQVLAAAVRPGAGGHGADQ